MEYEIRDESEKNRFIIKLSGRLSMDDHSAMLKELVSHPHWKKGRKMLVDVRQVSAQGVGADEMVALAKTIGPFKDKLGPTRHAFVCSEGTYSLTSMFHYIVDDQVGWTSKLFTADEYEAALTWLAQEG